MVISLLTASVWVVDHVKVVPFFRRFVRGRTMCAKPRMKGH